MTIHLQREISQLKKMILSLGARVEESVQRAARAIASWDAGLAEDIIDEDIEIDEMEVQVEEECLKILALHQPVAIDLRYIIAVLKINNDLERIGDLAVNIAQGCNYLTDHEPVDMPFDFPHMARKAQEMVGNSLDALINMDPDLAREVHAADDEVDEINRDMYDLVGKALRENRHNPDVLLRLMTVSQNLERIGDHATNIAEDVVYMSEGQIVRHKEEV
jgi:phosphate transport system protein